jgi:hypothetical protein
MKLIPNDPNKFDLALLVAIASGTSAPEEVQATFGLSPEAYASLMANPLFLQAVTGVRQDLLKNGSMLSIRAGYVLAEVAIPEMQDILQSIDSDPEAKIKAVHALIKIQEIGAAPGNAKDKGDGRAGVTITINTNPVPVGRAKPEVIEATVSEVKIGSD